MSAHFNPAMFKFLKELKANNDRTWFADNRDRFEEVVREPLIRFVLEFGPKLRKISPEFSADPRPVGGSIFRIHRDTRFSKDKTPYKTHASAQFRHVRGKDVHAPGFYLHLEPGNVFLGAGIWRPDTRSAAGIREAIAEDPAAWKRAVRGKAFREAFRLEGESLKRPPRGMDPEHPLLEDLKRKDFIAVRDFTQRDACGADFVDRYAEACRGAAPLVRFLTRALELGW
jgi:uncharacterized protein (TIGR02453 family)